MLAGELDAHIHALDLFPAFLKVLEKRSEDTGVSDKISTVAASMDELPFEAGSLDAIWSEGAIYNIGFAKGVAAWRECLKQGGILAVSELTWLGAQRPAELEAHWAREYPEVDTASAKMAILEASGYSPIGYFPLPEACWLANYYEPLEARFADFLDRHGRSEIARAIVEAERGEIELYRRFRAHVSYGFYIAKRD